MRAFILLFLWTSIAYAGSHTDKIPGSAAFRFVDFYGVYDIQLAGPQGTLTVHARIKKITGYTGLIWLDTDRLGKCHGRYKIPMVGKISTAEKPVIISYSFGDCYIAHKKTRFDATLYFPHTFMDRTPRPMQAIFGLGSINGDTIKFTSGKVIKTLGLIGGSGVSP